VDHGSAEDALGRRVADLASHFWALVHAVEDLVAVTARATVFIEGHARTLPGASTLPLAHRVRLGIQSYAN
jgi:hypothetical protein